MQEKQSGVSRRERVGGNFSSREVRESAGPAGARPRSRAYGPYPRDGRHESRSLASCATRSGWGQPYKSGGGARNFLRDFTCDLNGKRLRRFGAQSSCLAKPAQLRENDQPWRSSYCYRLKKRWGDGSAVAHEGYSMISTKTLCVRGSTRNWPDHSHTHKR